MPAKFKNKIDKCRIPSISQSVIAKSKSQELTISLDAEKLLLSLSFTHFSRLLKINDPLKRSFYELERIKCGWTTRELSRQIGSLYFERLGLSKNKKKLVKMVRAQMSPKKPSDIIRDPYKFEFLGLKPHELMFENNLRDALVLIISYLYLNIACNYQARRKSKNFSNKNCKKNNLTQIPKPTGHAAVAFRHSAHILKLLHHFAHAFFRHFFHHFLHLSELF